MNWIEVPAGKYTLLDGPKKKSTCQIEMDVPSVIQLERQTSQLIFILQLSCVHLTCTGRRLVKDRASTNPQFRH